MSITADADVLALFEIEATERLARIGDLLLDLEASPADGELVAALFREAHTLKGAAAVVGFDDLAAEAHALEELLAQARAGAIDVTPEVVAELLDAVDHLHRMSLGVTDDDHDDALGHDAAIALPRSRGETARVAVDRLDELVRLAGESAAAHQRVADLVATHLGFDPYAVPEMRALSRLLTDLQERALRARMLPVDAVAAALRRAVRDAARRSGKLVACEVRGGDTELDRTVHEVLADALIHLVRNAVDHGIEDPHSRLSAGKPEQGTVVVHAMQLGSRVVITVSDDGRGIDLDAVREEARRRGWRADGLSEADAHALLFRPGFSTASSVTDLSGRGVGLDAVREALGRLRGRVEVSSTPGGGTRFRISVPITLTVLRSVIVEAGGARYALGLSSVVRVLPATTPDVAVDDGVAVRFDDQVVPVASLAELLGAPRGPAGPVVVLSSVLGTQAVRVDAVGAQRDVLVSAVPAVVPPHDLVVGASAEADGTVLVVLDADGIIEAASGRVAGSSVAAPGEGAPAITASRARVLVVDDAMTVRELQRTILGRAGYEVRTAGDGEEALRLLEQEPFDLVLTDLEMPRLDGLSLTRAIRATEGLAHLPVVVLTSRGGEDDRRLGMEAGADAYIVKSSFDEASLLRAVEGLLGP